MKIKQAMRYQLREHIGGAGIYYAVLALVYLLTVILMWLIGQPHNGLSTSPDISTLITLFIMGLNSFKSQFRLFVQNGLSRRTLIAGFLLSALALSVLTTAVNGLIALVLGGESYLSLFSLLYGRSGAAGLLWALLANYAMILTGFLISSLYYRMDTLLRIAVSVGVPLVLFVVLPVLESMGIRIFTSLMRGIAWALGLDSAPTVHPLRAAASFCAYGAAMAGFSYLLVRRATIRDT